MAITDELREYANIATDRDIYAGARLCKIADRIDERHERDLRESYDSGYASADDWLAQHEDAMAEHGWVRLPLDADGEPIRVGDVMVMASHPFGCEDKPLVVDRMELSRSMHGEVWCLALDTDRDCWTQAAVLRHHHVPTVEDVLREFAEKVTDSQIPGVHPTYEEAIAEYAKRLRMVEEVDE